MMGLLDSLFSEDPNNAAYVALASGLLGGRGSFNSAASKALLNAQGVYSQASQDRRRNELVQAQMEKLRADAERMKLHPWKDPAVPSAIQLYEYTQKLTPEQRTQFERIQRGANIFEMNGIKYFMDPVRGPTPLTDLQTQSGAEATIAGAKQTALEEAKAKYDLVPQFNPVTKSVEMRPRLDVIKPSIGQQETPQSLPTGPLMSNSPNLMQQLIEDARRSGDKGFDFNIGGAKGSVKVPDEKPRIIDQVVPVERQKLMMDEPAAASVTTSALQMSERIKSIASELKNHPGLPSIVGKISQYAALDLLPSTRDARALQDSLVNQIGIQALNDMRQMSKTGGAVGQVTEREWPILQQSIAALGKAQTPEAYKIALDNLVQQTDASMARVKDAYEKTYGPIDYKSAEHVKQGGSGDVLTPSEQKELETLRNRFGKKP